MTKNFQVIIEQDADGWFVGSARSLPGCHSQARSLDVLMERMREAIALALEGQGPEQATELELVGIQRLAVTV